MSKQSVEFKKEIVSVDGVERAVNVPTSLFNSEEAEKGKDRALAQVDEVFKKETQPQKLAQEKGHNSRNKKGAVKDDAKKPRVSLLPLLALAEEAKVMTYGAEKYDSYNWMEGFDFTTLTDALLRHTFAYLMGEDTDMESGLSHLAHIRCCAGMLYDITQLYPERDDRWSKWKDHPDAVAKAKAPFERSEYLIKLLERTGKR